MCVYPIVKFACCDTQFRPDEGLPIVKFCPRGHGDTIGEPFPGCPVRQAHECHDFFRLPVKCPDHKLQWLTRMDLNAECQATDRALGEAGVSEPLRRRYRDKMGRAFEMVVKCAQLMEAERLQAWKVKVFCTGAALELLGTAIVGSDAKPLDYAVLESLRERLVRHINAEAQQLKEDAIRRGGRSPEEAEHPGLGTEREWFRQSQSRTSASSPPRSPSPAADCRRVPALEGAPPPIGTAITTTPAPNLPLLDDMQQHTSREFLPGRPSQRFLTMAFSPPQAPFHQDPAPIFPFAVLPLSANRFPPGPPSFMPSRDVGPAFSLGGVSNGTCTDNLPVLPPFISQYPMPLPLSPERQFQMQQSAVTDGQFVDPVLGFSAGYMPRGGLGGDMYDMMSVGIGEDEASDDDLGHLARAEEGAFAFDGGVVERCLMSQAPAQMEE
ncbi:uncharacterized protein B0T15DRAFT_509874 [Chaetomium strumarium]|uniref:Uncharacterized protein n=1 Tax=Chaetomium strumarium TaxID=1170767 RepID=A0AAJ0GUR6_9PEZI|nr:hypothetical protein B0T15DRAFT_509874 [Chaetomium strumarium]